jgi:hypothetical protein
VLRLILIYTDQKHRFFQKSAKIARAAGKREETGAFQLASTPGKARRGQQAEKK